MLMTLGTGAIMWNEGKMPARWYVIKDGSIVEDDRLEEHLTLAQSLDRQMRQVMRQAIAEVLAR